MSSNIDQFIAGGVGGMAGVIAGHPLGESRPLLVFFDSHN